MNVTYGDEPKKEESKYPYFGHYTNNSGIDFVVMFVAPETGMIVKTNSTNRPLYAFGEQWSEEYYVKLDNFSVTFSVP